MKKRICLLITCFSFMSAYSANHKVTGSIKDIVQNSIPAATIRILAPDSSFVKGSVTDEKGEFCLDNIKKGKYILSASCIGYTNRFLDFEMPDKDYELPTVILEENNVMLEGVTVTGASVIQKKDHLLIIPDKQQVKHAYTGYDLLYNLMIPGVVVNRKEGAVTTSRGSATLYINGVKADFHEIQNLRPKDIERVEYFDMPTGDYLGDIASVNYITKVYKTGGSISIDGEQTIGYLGGKYNIGSQVAHNNTNYTFFGGYNMREYDGIETSSTENFKFPNYTVSRDKNNSYANFNNNQQYAQFKVSNSTGKRNMYGLVSFVRDETPHNDKGENLLYSGSQEKLIQSVENSSQESFKPSASFYGDFRLTNKQRLRLILNGSYTNNTYNRTYKEEKAISQTDVNEDLYSFSAVGIYNIKFNHNNSLEWNIQHHHNITSSTYSGDYNSWQHLWKGESLSFLSYTQDIGKLSFTISPGVSLLQYQLHEDNAQYFWTFRTHSWLTYNINSKNQLFAGLAIGNYSPSINTINSVDQTVDFLTIKRGNPYLDNTKIYEYFLTYNTQLNPVNLQFNLTYTTLSDNLTNDYYIENDKLISSYRSNSSFHTIKSELLSSYRISDNLQTQATLRYEHMNVPNHANWKENNFFASLDVNYFIRSFAINAYAKTTERKLDQTSLVYMKTPASYGLSVRYSGKSWMAEVGTENPFTKHQHYREYADYGVYQYNQVHTSRIYQQTGYIKLAYTFDFGKKISKEERSVDTSINSGILKAK